MGNDTGFRKPDDGDFDVAPDAAAPENEDGTTEDVEEELKPATAEQRLAAGFTPAPAEPKAATATVQEIRPPASLGPASGSVDPGQQEVPVDLVETAAPGSRTRATGELHDAASELREKRLPTDVLRKEETKEDAWRKLLSNLQTTRLVHVKLMKQVAGSYVQAGARYNIDLNEIREPEQLVPYGTGSNMPQRWILKVAPATARADDDAMYREFLFERIGPLPPAGWSLDSPLAFANQEIAEDDMATYNDVVTAVLTQVRANPTAYGIPGATPGAPGAPAPGQPPPWPGYPPPQYPYPPYGMPGAMPFGMQRSDDDRDRDRRDRDERERLDRLDKERRDREERDRLERDRLDKERRDDREKFEAAQKVSEDRHARDAEATRKALEDMRAEGAKREAEHREQIAKLERDRAEAEHRAQIGSVTSTLDALKTQIADLKDGGGKKGAGDWTTLAQTFAPMITSYLTNQQSSASDERRFRLEDTSRERDRMMADSERMNRLFGSLGESHTSAAKMAADLIQRMQDPSAIMNMTRLVSETLGGNIQMMAQLARSGLMGNKGGSEIPWGDLIGRGLEIGGQLVGGMVDQKTKQMEMLAGAPMMPGQPAFGGAQQPPQMPPGPQPQMLPPAGVPQNPMSPQAMAARRAPIFKMMTDEINLAIRNEAPPADVAALIDSLVYTVEQWKLSELDPASHGLVQRLRDDAEKELLRLFPRVNPEYIRAIVHALMAKVHGSRPQPQAPQPPPMAQQPAPPAPDPLVPPIQVPQQAAPLATPPMPQPQAPAPQAQPSSPPTQAMHPAKRGRGRPPKPKDDGQQPGTTQVPAAAPPPVQAPPAAPAPATPQS